MNELYYLVNTLIAYSVRLAIQTRRKEASFGPSDKSVLKMLFFVVLMLKSINC